MNTKPEIILSALDLERLERLLEKTQFPGKDELESELERANVMDPKDIPGDVVTMNSTVRFRELPDDAEFSLTLVYPKDAGQEGTVSILAPVGAALLGLSVGAEIEWPSPKGRTLRVRIEEIIYQPERAGEFHR
ncbi:nucleoside diphosphate kinase regulator [Venatoribacter cucullus]|uniref:nucleoside diphosphate kinase regulator n=1 Tax=Venatoribacter cucullus TaxID=2661630 RepID=UPI00223FF110|nr:nucleoside diphosphate kinase regulator [Venatoribacter cucullus]UZK04225.1 nucleoside diphosphate kinase regulator [Venatoribacter cucullus]